MKEVAMSMAKKIKALALINIRDIFQFTISATDAQIVERYGSEEKALEVAEKYLQIASKADILEYPIKGWSMEYSQPTTDGQRTTYKACFYDQTDNEQHSRKKDDTDWVRVSERLPDPDPRDPEEYLITVENEDCGTRIRDVYKGFYQGGKWFTQWCNGCEALDVTNARNPFETEVIAWAPLPEAYKGEK